MFWEDCFYIHQYFPQKQLFKPPITFYYPPEHTNADDLLCFFELCDTLYDSLEKKSDDFKYKLNELNDSGKIYKVIDTANNWGHLQLLLRIFVNNDLNLHKHLIPILSKNLRKLVEFPFQNAGSHHKISFTDLPFEDMVDIFTQCPDADLPEQKQIMSLFLSYVNTKTDIRCVFFVSFLHPKELEKEDVKKVSVILRGLECLHMYPQFASREDIVADLYLY
ncbi:hypothetical protein GPJ56_002260 [Histomonas meleagridis]|uniref:uncharacterized protein n=1 Tax=Histomonas meleagridis TaxID=135588 RepID=UPI003559722F|nr:hypothetical protein GPJ56_002260 [Histomonas meleagridis]KAH0802952.1 hypothetical protein GO595_004459 [Histomonas meleagridis]